VTTEKTRRARQPREANGRQLCLVPCSIYLRKPTFIVTVGVSPVAQFGLLHCKIPSYIAAGLVEGEVI
jgi:hypothetical protein